MKNPNLSFGAMLGRKEDFDYFQIPLLKQIQLIFKVTAYELVFAKRHFVRKKLPQIEYFLCNENGWWKPTKQRLAVLV